MDGSSTPFYFFPIFFPEFTINHIKTETNRYAKSIADKLRGTNKLKPHSIWQTWTEVRLPEMYLFFVVIIYMCLVKKPKLRDYWSTSNFISTQFSRSVMSRSQFTVILSNLHVNDNSMYIPRNEPSHDPMHKIRHFSDHLLTHFPTSFSPYKNLTIDEGVCGFWGRVIFLVYIKYKPDKYGITMFAVCDSKTGYVLRSEVYTGKSQ